MAPIKPFKIDIPQDAIDLVHKKLDLATFPDELDDSGWAYGAPLGDIKRLVEYWRTKYDWRKQEAKLNELPHFQTEINVDKFGPVNMHFLHQKSSVENAIPLLFVHGWPGSFYEATKILPELVKGGNGNPAFHVVVPSLPNYGFSSGISKKGFGQRQYAESCHKVMQALGYDKYVTQGGDWGYFITRCIGIYYPEHCLASHINLAFPSAPSWDTPFTALRFYAGAIFGLSEGEMKGIARAKWFDKEGSGYYKEQATRPQTLAYSLNDSPVGLLAWIYEKLHDWTDSYPWTEDEVLTWISIYAYSTAGPGAASRIYYETNHDPEKHQQKIGSWVGGVKLGIARFPKEIALMPKAWNHRMGPCVYESEYDRGGHFAAFERPDAIVDDLQKMFGKKGPCASIVPSQSGYDAGSRL